MRKIALCDMTLTEKGSGLSFKEKLEIARVLGSLNVDAIEFPAIENARTDTLLVRTVSAFFKTGVLCVDAGRTKESVEAAANALSAAQLPRLKIALPMSAVCMEYECHRKPPKMLELIDTLVRAAKEKCADVEFCALDATRAEEEFLVSALKTAVNAGATEVSVCDTAGETMPDDFASFVGRLKEAVGDLPFGVAVCDKNGLSLAGAVLAVKAGASAVRTATAGDSFTSFATLAAFLKNCGSTQGFSTGIRMTELTRSLSQISWIMGKETEKKAAVSVADTASLDASADPATVASLVKSLGYDLSDEDNASVYAEFKRVAEKKALTAKELDAIVASVALQVPPTYQLTSYVINNGNIITASAQITLTKNGETLMGIGIGDGPVDAAFRTVDSIVGRHYELDDFSIQSVTEGREAVGSALVRLRRDGKLYSGNGISTDIIGAAIRAYLGAINKIVYEEN